MTIHRRRSLRGRRWAYRLIGDDGLSLCSRGPLTAGPRVDQGQPSQLHVFWPTAKGRWLYSFSFLFPPRGAAGAPVARVFSRPPCRKPGGTFSVAKTPRYLSVSNQIVVLSALIGPDPSLPWLIPRKGLYIGLPVGYAHSQWLA
jgi:hypothetical protein